MTSNLTIGSGGKEIPGEAPALRADHYEEEWESNFSASEIEEEFSGEMFDINNNKNILRLESIREDGEGSVYSFDYYGSGDAVVYVGVGKQSEEKLSMDALVWTLNNVVIPSSTVVFLIHVFPETKFIPTPLGKLPISQVNPEQKDNFIRQERGKRREYLQRFLNICSNSQVQVDTILIESDMEAKSILDLIPVLNIRKLVLGSTKSNARRMRSKRGNGVANEILNNAPEFCDVKIICEGKEMADLAMDSSSTASSPRAADRDRSPKFSQQLQEPSDSSACGCFKL